MPRPKGLGTGTTRPLPSGRIRAEFRAPDGSRPSKTFRTQHQADLWLAAQQVDVARAVWQAPKPQQPTFKEFATAWIDSRTNREGRPIAPRTREEYHAYVRNHCQAIHGIPVDEVTPAAIRDLYGRMNGTPTTQANTYGLLAAVFKTAVKDELIVRSPCRIEGGTKKRRKHKVVILTPAEVVQAADAMPARLRMLLLLTVWDALRQGEGFELRRKYVAPDCSSFWVWNGVSYTKGEKHVLDPKTEASRRPQAVPPHLRPLLAEHMRIWVDPEPDALLFTSSRGSQLRSSSLYEPWWYRARKEIGHPTMHWHDLRHTGATLAAMTGATLRDLMDLLGHETVVMALHYQQSVDGQKEALADRLSALAEAGKPQLRVVGQ